MNRNILIVDDDEAIRHVVRLICESEGYREIVEVETGAEALIAAETFKPDVIILDYLMPVLDGEQTAEALRKLVPEAKVVAFSAILERKPDWADAFLNKQSILRMAPLLAALSA